MAQGAAVGRKSGGALVVQEVARAVLAVDQHGVLLQGVEEGDERQPAL